MKSKPTYDDLISALYEILEIVDEVILENDLECEDDTPTITRIQDICENILPEQRYTMTKKGEVKWEADVFQSRVSNLKKLHV